jgi:hypothetical protein
VLVAVLVVAAVAAGGAWLGRSKDAAPATISVTGTGMVRGTPDTVTFSVGVQTTGSTATGALNANSARVRQLTAALLRHGVTKANLQTSGLSIYENTNQYGNFTGFTVNNTLTVTLHKVSDAGGAIQAAADAAGNGLTFDGVTFSITNESGLLASARARAIQNAHLEASQLANGGGTTVGSIVKVVDQESSSSGPEYPVTYGLDATAFHSVPISPGSQAVSVQVTVVYALAS